MLAEGELTVEKVEQVLRDNGVAVVTHEPFLPGRLATFYRRSGIIVEPMAGFLTDESGQIRQVAVLADSERVEQISTVASYTLVGERRSKEEVDNELQSKGLTRILDLNTNVVGFKLRRPN